MRNKNILRNIKSAMKVLQQLHAALNDAQLNAVPFEGSWTVAQVLTHVIKSNNAITQAMAMECKPATREIDLRVGELKKIFLNFDCKMKSPAFIVPLPGWYEKAALAAALEQSTQQLYKMCGQQDLSGVIEFSAFSQVTRLELLYFVWYHTRRHIEQVKNIWRYLPAAPVPDD